MKELNRFLQLFIKAVNKVDEQYFRTAYNVHFELPFERYSERGFAYELYHQLRILLDKERSKNRSFLEGMFLQGEIKKLQAPYILETFKYFPLDGNYSPDLLMHTPSADDNAFVIEIKTQPNINMQLILHDLDKIGQFLNRFNYDCGIFLAVNSNPNELLEFLNSYIEYLMDKITLARFEHFHIIVKENYDSEIFHCTLFDILDQPFWNKFKTYS